jgi:hypothetical protein
MIHRLPFYERETTADSPDGEVVVRPYQIILWVSLSPKDVLDLPADTPRFPAVLDTGLNHNFAIRQSHFETWAGLRPLTVGRIYLGNTVLPLVDATVWLHPNVSGERDALTAPPLRLECQDGIAVYPPGANPARLPTLGLRSLAKNRLKVMIDGEKKEVTVSF